MIPVYLIYLAANIGAVFFLIRMGGVLPILCSIIILLGQIAVSGICLAAIYDVYSEKRKRKETKNDVGMGE